MFYKHFRDRQDMKPAAFWLVFKERPIFLQYRVTTKGSHLSNEATRFLEAINENVSGRSYRSGTSERFLVLRNTRGHMCISCRNSSSEQLALNED
jgi:hypothetical protein